MFAFFSRVNRGSLWNLSPRRRMVSAHGVATGTPLDAAIAREPTCRLPAAVNAATSSVVCLTASIEVMTSSIKLIVGQGLSVINHNSPPDRVATTREN